MDDATLLDNFRQSGGQEAFGLLVSRHVHFVYSSCLRQLGDAAAADQATAAAFVLLAQNARKLRAGTPLVPWLFNAAYHACATIRRMNGRFPTPLAPREGVYVAPSDWANLARDFDDALASLPSHSRDALLLKYVANWSLHQVADAMDVEDRTAGQRIADGVARLRRHYESRNLALAPDALVAAIQAHAVSAAPGPVAYNATLAALTSDSAPGPAVALANDVTRRVRIARMISVASSVCIILLVGALVWRIYGMIKRAPVATTQPTAVPLGSNQTVTIPPAHTTVPRVEKPPATKPTKSLDPQLSARFIAAIRAGDFDMVERMVELEEALVNARDPASGRTAAQVAAERVNWQQRESTKIAHFLLNHGAHPDIYTAARAGHADWVASWIAVNPALLNAPDEAGLTAMQRAGLIGGSSPECEAVVDLLMQRHAKVDLWTAATFGRVGDVEQRLMENPKQVNEARLGGTPLAWAARPRRYTEDPLIIARKLLEAGADLNARDALHDGMTPLHHAAEWGAQPQLLEFFLDRGADVNVSDDYGWTPLDYAIDRNHRELIAFLTGKGGKRTTVSYSDLPSKTTRFFAAIRDGDADLVKRLLDDTPELAKTRGPTGETPLHQAAARGDIAMIDLLLADRADINAQETNKFGGTPLHWAVRKGRVGAVRHLLAKGADPKALNLRSGHTLLHAAAQSGAGAEMQKVLESLGIDASIKDRKGNTPADYQKR